MTKIVFKACGDQLGYANCLHALAFAEQRSSLRSKL